jgi:uridine kinase
MSPTTIVKRNGRAVPFDQEKITVAIYKAMAAGGAHDRQLAEGLSDQVVAALDSAYTDEQLPTVEDIQDFVERVLIRGSHAETAKRYILYRNERAQMRTRRQREQIELIPYKAMWQALDWAVEHGCHTVADLNRIIREDRLPQLIGAADDLYERTIEQVAAAVLERRDELRFIIVAGPSSSGKTTTTNKLAAHLEAAGLPVVPLALDNYFFDLRLHPRDELGDYDFETPEALDLELINHHLAEIDAGRPIDMPVYDFKTGNRLEKTTRFAARPGSVVLLDTLHGLYDGLTASVPDEHKCRLYIETISQLKTNEGRYMRWADIRLLRRMVRDAKFRGYEPERTIQHWHYVRRSELKHIIPHQSRADFHVNGALAYELPFLKLHLFHYFPEFIRRWRNDDQRLDGYIRARRIHDLLASIEDVADDDDVPPKSLLREFIGGSAYDLH